MKKFLCVLILCVIPVVAFSDGIDLSSMSFDDLIALRYKIDSEILSRPEWKETEVPQGTWVVGEDIPAGSYSIRAKATDDSVLIRIYKNSNDSIGNAHYIYQDNQIIGKIILSDGMIVELSNLAIFAPPKGLGF